LRQLLWMVEGHGREQWAHTSVICALIANTHRDPRKGRSFSPDDFNPYANPRARRSDGTSGGGDVIEVNSETVSIMRAAFTGHPRN